MDTTDTTNLEPETQEVQEQEVELEEEVAEEFDADGNPLEAEDDSEELDIDGEPLKVPKTVAEKLKARMMMQADYTQKTQAIAEQRREYEQQRQAFERETQVRQELFSEEAQLHGVRERLQQYQNVNWSQIAAQNPQQAAVWQAEYTQLKDYHDRLSGHVQGRKSELEAQREQATATTISRAIEHLSKPAPNLGWDGKFDAEKRASLTKFGTEIGFTNEELANTTHPLMLQTLNLARIGYETLRKQNATLAKPKVEVKPVPQVGAGKTRTGPVNPDKLPMDQWLKWRNSQAAKQGNR